jgi:hypothetical protein
MIARLNVRQLVSRLLVLAASALTFALGGASASQAQAPTLLEGGLSNAGAGVGVSSDGWIHYGEPAVNSVPTESKQTITIKGRKTNHGCSVSSSYTLSASSGGVVEEPIAYNPATCEETVIRAVVSAAVLNELENESGGTGSSTAPAEAPSGTAKAAPQAKAPKKPSGAAPQAAPTVPQTYYNSAHTKTKYIDPPSITITSLVVDLSWPLYGASGRVQSAAHSYEFPFDFWTNSGIKGPYLNEVVSGGVPAWEASAHEDFYNSTFVLLLGAISRLAATACSVPWETAHFRHNLKVIGKENNTASFIVEEDKAEGACSNLVRHETYTGFGWGGSEKEYVDGKIASYEGESRAEAAAIAKTPPPVPAPAVTALSASAINVSAGTLNGSVNPLGSDTHYHFEYGSAGEGYPSSTPEGDAGSGGNPVEVSARIGGLRPATQYHYRLVATSAGGTTTGGEETFTTAPVYGMSAVVLRDGSRDTYFRGENGAIWQATNYGAVKELGGEAAGNPAAVALPNGEQDVYFRGTDGAIWQWSLNPANGAWTLTRIGGTAAGDPAVAQGNPYSVFFRASEGCIACIDQLYKAGGTWHTEWIGGSSAGDPTAVAGAGGSEQVFWVGTDGAVWDWASPHPTEGGWSVTRIGGTPDVEKPAVVLHPDKTESVYFRAREGCIGCIDQLYWNGSSWRTEWIGGSAAGAPVAAEEGTTQQSVYWRGTDGAIWEWYGNPAAGQWNVSNLGGKAAGDPAEAYSASAGTPTSLFYFEQNEGSNESEGISELSLSLAWGINKVCIWPCGPSESAVPHVTSVTPSGGKGTGGTNVRITGSGMSGATAVRFGGHATTFSVLSATEISTVAPPGFGSVDVTVVSQSGTSATSSADIFTYEPYKTTSRPSAVALADGSEYIYFRGENGAIWQADNFGGVKELGGHAIGSPAAVALSTGERDVYFLGTNGAIWRWYFNPASQSWSLNEIGGVTAGEPTVTAGDPYSIYFRQTEGCRSCIYHGYLSGATWITEALGGDAAGDPTVVTVPGEEQIFWAEAGGAADISEWYWNASGWHYARVGGTPTTEKPAVVVRPNGSESVYFRAREGCIECVDQLYWNGSSWRTEWIGGSLAGIPTAANEGNSQENVFWRGNNASIWDTHGNPSVEHGSESTPVAANAASDPSETYSAGAPAPINVYYIDQAGGLTDAYLKEAAWHSRQLCEWPCAARAPERPIVRNVTPSHGKSEGGTAVTIEGADFTEVSSVKFGSVSASSFTVQSASKITATAPAGSGLVNVTVTDAGGASSTTANDQFGYLPVVTKVSPGKGSVVGGTKVTISGTGFIGVSGVTFNGVEAESYSVNSEVKLTAIAPSEGAGVVNIQVHAAGGTSEPSAADVYEVAPTVESVTPSSGPVAGGTAVTIRGTGFGTGTGATTIKFGSASVTTLNCPSTTECTAISPARKAGTVDVKATVAEVSSANTRPGDQFTFE